MRLIAFLLLILPVISFADGPKYQQKDSKLDDEISNIYFDIKNPVIRYGVASTFTVTNLTITGALSVSTSTTLGKVLQIVYSSSTAGTTTTSTSYVDTASSVTITPKSTTSRILITANGVMGMTTSATQWGGFATIANGSTNILGTSGGCDLLAFPVATGLNRASCCMQAIDAPATLTAQTYRVRIKSEDSSVTTSWRPDSNVTHYMTAIEYEPS